MVLVYTAAERHSRRALASAGAVFVPGVMVYFASGIGQNNGTELYFRGWPEKYHDALAALVHGYSPRLETLTLGAAVLCVLLARARNSEFRLQRLWLWVAAALLALYAVLPDEVGQGWDVDVRVLPLLLVALLAAARLGSRQRLLAFAALLLFALRTADVARGFVRKQAEIASTLGAIQRLPRNSRILPLIRENDDDDPLQRLTRICGRTAWLRVGPWLPICST